MVLTTTTDAKQNYKLAAVVAANINYPASPDTNPDLVEQMRLGQDKVKTEKEKNKAAKEARKAWNKAALATKKETKEKSKTDEEDKDYCEELYIVNA